MNRSRLLVLIVIVGILLRVGVSLFIGGDFAWPDEKNDYHPQAIRLSQGEGWGDKANIMPLFPTLLAGLFIVSQGNILLTRILLGLLSSGIILVVFHIARRLFGDSTARVSAFIVACHPLIVYASVLLLPEILFSLLMGLGFLFCLKASERNQNLWVAALSFSLASLTISLTFPFFVLSLALLWHTLRGKMRTKKLALIGLYALIFTLPIFLWGLRNYLSMNEFLMVKGNYGKLLYLHNNEYASGFARRENYEFFQSVLLPRIENDLQGKSYPEKDREFRRRAIAFIREHPGQFLRLCAERFLNLWRWSPDTISQSRFESPLYTFVGAAVFLPFLLLSFAGLLTAVRGNREHWIVLAYLISLMTIFTVTRSSLRARVPLEPFLAIYAAVGLNWLFHVLKRRANPGAEMEQSLP